MKTLTHARSLAFALVVTLPLPLAQGARSSPLEPTAPPTARSSLDMSLATLAKAEVGAMSLTLKNEVLETAVERFRQVAGVPILVDWDALAAIGVARDDLISFEVADAPALVALKVFAASIEAEIEEPVVDATAGQLLITSPRGRSAFRETAIYDVADILADPFLIDAVAALRRQAANRSGDADEDEDGKDEQDAKVDGDAGEAKRDPSQPNGGAATVSPKPTSASANDGGVAVVTTATARGERLIEIIVDHIDPEGWDYSGGSRGKMTHEAGRLIITATALTHESIRGFLTDLRQQSPSSATTSWTIAALPNASLDAIVAEARPEADAASLLAATRSAPGFRILSTPRVSARLDDQGVIESSDAHGSARCTVTVSLDRAHRSLSVRTSVQLTDAGSKGAAESTLTGRGDRISGLLRLACGPREGETWVVLVETVADRRE